MRLRLLLIPLAILALSLAAACGGDDDDDAAGDDGGDQPTQTDAPDGAADPTDAPDDGDDDDDGGNDGGGFGSGTGTLIIGDESWEITGIGCVFSAEEARNADFPFNLSGFGESSTGARAQLSADIYDPSGEERTEGEGVSHNITFTDIEDFENPSIDWRDAGTLFPNATDTKLTIDGKHVTGVAAFDDGTTAELETIEGTLDVQCS